MKLQKTLLSALVASAAVMAFQPASAAPVFQIGTNVVGDTSLNDIELINRENIYRASTACTTATCLPFDPANDPAGYQRPNPNVPNNVQAGDLFAGVLNLRIISNQDTGTTWQSDNIAAGGIDTFTGYFLQQVNSVAPVSASSARILLETPTVADPFGVLNTALGQSVGFWVDDGAGTVFSSDGITLTTFASVASATDGDLWALLGIGSTPAGTTAGAPLFDGDGYAYSEVNIGGGLQTFGGNFYVGYDILSTGSAFNLAGVRPINDPNELLFGAIGTDPAAGSPSTALNNYFGVCTATATYACNDIVGNGQLTPNQNLSPWLFASEDPLQLNAIPEPATLGLLGLGLLGLGATMRRRAK